MSEQDRELAMVVMDERDSADARVQAVERQRDGLVRALRAVLRRGNLADPKLRGTVLAALQEARAA